MKKITLYTFSLLLTILAGLLLILLPMDEVYSSMLLATALMILSCILRSVSKDSNKKAWDLIVLFAVIIPVISVRLFSPMTMFFVSYDQTFIKIIAGIIIFISIIQLIIPIRDQKNIDRLKDIKNNRILFLVSIILTVLTFFGLDIYGKKIDIYNTLSSTERVYLYSYRKYSPEVIETAFKDIENGNGQIEFKMAIEYFGKMPNMNDVDKKRLHGVLFSKTVNEVGFETQISLMIKLDPERTIDILEDLTLDSSFNIRLEVLGFLGRIVGDNPGLKDKACVVGKKVYQMAKDQTAKDESGLIRLDFKNYGGGFRELCGIE
jgi:uncharacterized membrane protein HdeD (DUF308 family)